MAFTTTTKTITMTIENKETKFFASTYFIAKSEHQIIQNLNRLLSKMNFNFSCYSLDFAIHFLSQFSLLGNKSSASHPPKY